MLLLHSPILETWHPVSLKLGIKGAKLGPAPSGTPKFSRY